MSVSDAAQPGSVRKAQFAIVPMWVHRKIIATGTRTMAHAVYIELVGRYAGSSRDAEGLRVWPEIQQIADSMGVPKRNVQRALAVLVDCGVVLKKRTMRRNQYWLPQEEPDASTEALAGFQGATSGTLDSVQSATSGTSESAATGTLRSAATGTLYNPDPSIQTQETHLSLAPVVPKAEDAPARAAAIEERETDAAPNHNDNRTATSVATPATGTTPAAWGAGTDSQQQGPDGPQDGSQPPVDATAATETAQRIVDAYTAALGRPVTRATRERLHAQAAELLDGGLPETWLADRARELAANGWSDLAKHVERCPAPLPGAGPTAAASGLPPWCGRCGTDYGPAAEHNPRFRRLDDGALCHCHPDNIPTWSSGGHQPYRNPVDHSIYELDFDGRPLPGTDTRVAGWNALAGQLGGQPRPSITDARVQAALDLGRQMQAEYDAAQAVADGQDDEPGDGQDTVDDAELVDDDPSDGWQLMRQMIHANRVKRGTAR